MNEDKIKQVLSEIKEPVTNVDFTRLGFVRKISLNGNKLSLVLGNSMADKTSLDQTDQMIRRKFKNDIPEIEVEKIEFIPALTEHKNAKKDSVMPGVKNTIAVASGKGGVGKSTIAVNLAASFALKGLKTGLIDADIYGPSIPTMLGIKTKPSVTKVDGKNKLLPVEKSGIKIMSIGFLMEESNAVIWRGPMASSALKQFMSDVVWDELDVLFFDLPPGTGDIQLTLSQSIPLTGAVVVTTPQEISLADARKGVKMFERVNVPSLGVIENMSYYLNPDGSRDFIFGTGGGEKMSKEFNVRLLGEIPINTKIRKAGDDGEPIVISDPELPESKIFSDISDEVIREINLMNTKSAYGKDVIIEV